MDIIENKLLPAVKEGNLKSVKSLLDNEAVKTFFNHSKATKVLKRSQQGQYFTEDGFLIIHVAAAHGHTELVKLFLDYFELDVLNKEFETPLMVAVFYNQEETVKFLLGSGANVNYQSDPLNERSVLLVACAKGHGKIVKLLLDHGAKIFTEVKSIKSAMASGQKDVIEMLLKQSNYKQIYYKEALHVALDLKDVEMTKMIMENGKGSKSIVKFLSNCGFLTTAVSTSTVVIVQLLLDAGVHVNPKNRWTALHEAASIKSVEIVKLLLEKDADPNLQDSRNQTPLHHAVDNRCLEIVKLLAEKGADLDIKDISCKSPLRCAVENGYCDIVKLLAEKGADLNIQDNSGATPLHCAVKDRNLDMIELLSQKGANLNIQDKSDNRTSLHYAVENGYCDIVELLTHKGADVNVQDESGRTSLHDAVVRRNLKMIQLIAEKGADVNIQDKSGYTSLHHVLEDKYSKNSRAYVARCWGRAPPKKLATKKASLNFVKNYHQTSLDSAAENLTIIQLLVAKGANLNVQDNAGRTFLHYAAKEEESEVINFALDKGADVNIQDEINETPLHLVAKDGELELLQSMIEKGGDIKILGDDGQTLLHYAVKGENLELITFLLDQGADVNIRDKRKETPLHVAAKEGELEILELMIEKGGDMNALDRYNRTLLHYAVQGKNLELVKLLIDQGADVNAASMFGESALYFATSEKNQHIANYLLDCGAHIDTLAKHRLVFNLFDQRNSQILCRQIVKMQSKSLRVDKSNLEYIEKDEKLRAFAKECKKELDCMKEQEFDDTVVSLYEVFVTKDLLQLAAYASNENIINYVKSLEFMSKFSIYNVSVQRHLQRGCNRNFLLKRVCNFFLSLSKRQENKLPKLPATCIAEIFDCLSNSDLQNLRKSYY